MVQVGRLKKTVVTKVVKTVVVWVDLQVVALPALDLVRYRW
jgi:hypothetical protein